MVHKIKYVTGNDARQTELSNNPNFVDAFENFSTELFNTLEKKLDTEELAKSIGKPE